jgi:hypothetical protein
MATATASPAIDNREVPVWLRSTRPIAARRRRATRTSRGELATRMAMAVSSATSRLRANLNIARRIIASPFMLATLVNH